MSDPSIFTKHSRVWVTLLAALPLALGTAGAQKTVAGARPAPGEPCCNITAVAVRTGLVTARERSTGREFQFRVTNQAQLASLHSGQAVWADFGANKVAISYGEPCCGITGFLGTSASKTGSPTLALNPGSLVAPGTPCCGIVSIAPATDASGALVTARNTTSGAVFEFRVTDAALLQTLKVGQAIAANMATRQVTIYGLEPCCSITRVLSAGTP